MASHAKVSNGTVLDLSSGFVETALDTLLTNTTSAAVDAVSLPGIVSREVWAIFMVMNFVVLCGIITVFGSVVNVINIIVFAKLGFRDPVNITLLALSFSDFGCCSSLIWLTICYNPLFQQLENLPFDPVEFHYLTSGWIHNIFVRLTICITAFITFERCLCVVAPLRVKNIITPKTVGIYLGCAAAFVLGSMLVGFYTGRYVWRFRPDKNRTILSLVFIENAKEIDDIAFTFHGIILPVTAFFVVLVCTSILVVKLREKSKWRQNATSSASSSSANVSSRDARVSKMVVMVATLFIACFVPVFFSFVVILNVPGFSMQGRYSNLFLVLFSYHFALETLNSSLNIFIYYRMSSNYRAVFDRLFRRNQSSKEAKEIAS